MNSNICNKKYNKSIPLRFVGVPPPFLDSGDFLNSSLTYQAAAET